MLFGLLFGLMTNAQAERNEFNDLVYEVNSLLKRKKCDDAEDSVRNLLSDFPQNAESYLLKGLVMQCLKEHPEEIYPIFQQYIEYGGDPSVAETHISELEKELFDINIQLDFKTEDPSISLDEIKITLVPITIPNRDRVKSRKLERKEGSYQAKGLPPGKYNIEIESSSRLIQSLEKKIEGKQNKKHNEKITLPTVFDDFKEMIRLEDCLGVQKTFDIHENSLQESTRAQWQMSEKLCRAQREDTLAIWRESWEFSQKNLAYLTETHQEILDKNLATLSFSVKDQHGAIIPQGKLTIQLEDTPFTAEIMNGQAALEGIPFREAVISMEESWKYFSFSEKISFAKEANLPIPLQVEKKPSTVLKIPAFDQTMKIALVNANEHRVELAPAVDTEIVLGEYTMEAVFQGDTTRIPVNIKAEQAEISIPWAYAITDENGNIIQARTIFKPEKVLIDEDVTLALPQAPSVRVQGDIPPLRSGEAKIISLDLSLHPAHAVHQEILTTQQRIEANKKRNLLGAGTAALTTLMTGVFQLQALSAGAEARGIKDAEDADEYQELVDLTASKLTMTYGGYAAMGVSYSIWTLLMSKQSKQKKHLRTLEQQYSEKLQEPILFNK